MMSFFFRSVSPDPTHINTTPALVQSVILTREVMATLLVFLDLDQLPTFAVLSRTTGFLAHKFNESSSFKINACFDKKLQRSIQLSAKQLLKNDVIINDVHLKKAIENLSRGTGTADEMKLVAEAKDLNYRSEGEEICTNISKGTADFAIEIMKSSQKRSTRTSQTSQAELVIELGLLCISALTFIGGQIYSVYENHQKAKVHKHLQRRLMLLDNLEKSKPVRQQPEEKDPEENINVTMRRL